MIRLFLIVTSLSMILVACAGNTSVDGSANNYGGAGRVKIGWPF